RGLVWRQGGDLGGGYTRLHGVGTVSVQGLLRYRRGPKAARTMAPNHHRAKGANGCVWLWMLLTFIWFAANSSLALESIVTGALISAVLAYVLTREYDAWADIRFSPARLHHFSRYSGIFIVELVRANINMMRYVFAPRIDINPGIVEIKTRLKTPV